MVLKKDLVKSVFESVLKEDTYNVQPVSSDGIRLFSDTLFKYVDKSSVRFPAFNKKSQEIVNHWKDYIINHYEMILEAEKNSKPVLETLGYQIKNSVRNEFCRGIYLGKGFFALVIHNNVYGAYLTQE